MNDTDKQVAGILRDFTPAPDFLIEEYDLMTAAVWGKVWRYCNMKDGVCRASIQRLADELGLSYPTVFDRVKTLVAGGYIKDLTPDIKHKPHTYADTGKAGVEIVIRMGRSKGDLDLGLKEIETRSKGDLDLGLKEIEANKVIKERNNKDSLAPSAQETQQWFDERAPVVEERGPLTADQLKARTAAAVQSFARKREADPLALDFSRFGVYAQIAKRFHYLWPVHVPEQSESMFADWMKSLRELEITCGSYKAAPMYLVKHDEIEALKNGERCPDIGRPGALIKLCSAKVGRISQMKPKERDGYLQKILAEVEAAIRSGIGLNEQDVYLEDLGFTGA